MKKKHLSLAALVLAALVLAGCGAGRSGSTASYAAGNGMSTAMEKGWDMASTEEAAEPASMAPMAGSGAEAPQGAKRIYSANLELETTAFDDAVADLTALVERTGGYFESSSSGDYGRAYRSANYTVRVPAEQYRSFLDQAGALCHVLDRQEYTENVTEAYYDVDGRLKTQQTKLERLQELLARAESMEDIITIESAISDTEAQIESLSGQLRRYDALVDYSTVCISLNEVYKLSNVEEPATTFASRLGGAFASGWKSFVNGMEDLAVGLAYSWMWLVLLVAIVIAAAALVRKRLRKKRAALAKKADDKPEQT